jgi:hypothetical protein
MTILESTVKLVNCSDFVESAGKAGQESVAGVRGGKRGKGEKGKCPVWRGGEIRAEPKDAYSGAC